MIKGIVNEHGEPLVRIALIADGDRSFNHLAVVDTGFNGTLSLPEKLAHDCKWHWVGYESYEIATGDLVQEKVFLGKIRWFDRVQDVYAVTSHADVILLGTRLLQKNRLSIDFPKKKLKIL